MRWGSRGFSMIYNSQKKSLLLEIVKIADINQNQLSNQSWIKAIEDARWSSPDVPSPRETNCTDSLPTASLSHNGIWPAMCLASSIHYSCRHYRMATKLVQSHRLASCHRHRLHRGGLLHASRSRLITFKWMNWQTHSWLKSTTD